MTWLIFCTIQCRCKFVLRSSFQTDNCYFQLEASSSQPSITSRRRRQLRPFQGYARATSSLLVARSLGGLITMRPKRFRDEEMYINADVSMFLISLISVTPMRWSLAALFRYLRKLAAIAQLIVDDVAIGEGTRMRVIGEAKQARPIARTVRTSVT